MIRLVPLLAVAAIAAGCSRAPAGPAVTVENAIVTVPAVPGGPGAAYFTLRSSGPAGRLTGVSSPAFERAELHASMEQGGMSRMAPLDPDQARFSADAPLVFAPGGRHAMLFGLDPSLQPGAKIQLTFTIDPGHPIIADAEVRAPGDVHAEH